VGVTTTTWTRACTPRRSLTARTRRLHYECPSLESSLARPVLPFLDCRPPILVRVGLEGGRMLATSARMTNACAALFVFDTGFHTKGAGAATAGCACMTSALRMAESGELACPASPSASCLQAPNASARCTIRGAYAGNFCANDRCLCSAGHW
jgi:hypothetical protein